MSAQSEELDRLANRLQSKVNDRIQAEGKDWHPLEYRARAEMVVEEEVASKAWEWSILELVGGLPQFVIMSHDPRGE